jgi:hypothetical protein
MSKSSSFVEKRIVMVRNNIGKKEWPTLDSINVIQRAEAEKL